MQVKKVPKLPDSSGYEIMIDSARVATGMDALAWAKQGEELVREICVNSIDRDGNHTGYDIDITALISEAVNIPVIASGGAGKPEHLGGVHQNQRICWNYQLDAVFPRLSGLFMKELKAYLAEHGVPVRPWIDSCVEVEERS